MKIFGLDFFLSQREDSFSYATGGSGRQYLPAFEKNSKIRQLIASCNRDYRRYQKFQHLGDAKEIFSKHVRNKEEKFFDVVEDMYPDSFYYDSGTQSIEYSEYEAKYGFIVRISGKAKALQRGLFVEPRFDSLKGVEILRTIPNWSECGIIYTDVVAVITQPTICTLHYYNHNGYSSEEKIHFCADGSMKVEKIKVPEIIFGYNSTKCWFG